MSDEPTPKDQPSDWSMPEPVFRTSEGRNPKIVKPEADADNIDTEIPDLAEIGTGEQQPDGLRETRANSVRAAPVKIGKPKPSWAKSVFLIIAIIGFLAVAVIAGAVYFLFYFRTAESGPF